MSSKPKLLLLLLVLVSVVTLKAIHHNLYPADTRLPSNPIYQSDDPKAMTQVPPLPYAEELSALAPVRPAPKKVTTTVFMFRGDFSSPLFDLFTLQKRAIKFCDNETKVEGCDVHLEKSYRWGTLSSKLVDSLKVMCNSMKRTDFYVKIDDDLIMSETELERIIRTMGSTDCQVGGGIAVNYPFYWPVGQIYIFKRAVFDDICQKLPHATNLHSHEDIALGMLINSVDQKMFCSLDKPRSHWHKKYRDQRVRVEYLQQHNV
ncbi:hypothetical protein GGI11_006989 [Coemansia sp. RSA 2049]|nr:hypothetical protein GGI11_006989 [Coemansia sp. RSA 2049]KAJ2508865.1 hypothetical protein H4217_008456 [Coemansia sp. RSA 1939]KAJ2694552.1 hypothetical protein GGH99_000631 [Coemansia sp. RSA 1285]